MNHDSSPPSVETPWYKQPFVWMIILLPAASVVGGLTLLAISIINADSPVVDNWYKEGRTINQSMSQEALARRLGIGLQLAQVGAGIQARLTYHSAIPLPATLSVALRHPTLPEHDMQIELIQMEDNHYRADGFLPTQGRRAITVQPPEGHWRLSENANVVNSNVQLGVAPTP